MLKKNFIIAIIFVFTVLSTPFVFSENAEHIVINEIKLSGEKATEEYVKLYNPTDADVNLSGYRLSKKTASGTKTNLLTTFPDITIASKNYLIISHADYTGESNLKYSTTTSSIAENNLIVLYSDAGTTEADKVGMGSNTLGEGEAAPNPMSTEVLKRKVDGVDTDNNLADFVIVGPPQEEEEDNEAGEGVLAPDISGVIISEVMPDPKSPKTDSNDEWIELFNTNGNAVDLSGAILRDGVGTAREYTIPAGITIDAGRYAIFYSSATKITLNNSGDTVELMDANKISKDKATDFGKAKTDQSFARFQEGWDWTLEPTPLGENTQTIVEKEANKPAAYTLPKKQTKKIDTKKAKEIISKAKTATVKTTSPKVKKINVSAGSSKKEVEGDNKNEENLQKDDKIEAVKGASAEKPFDFNDPNVGKIILYVAIFLAVNYIVFREKIHEIFEQKFGRNAKKG